MSRMSHSAQLLALLTLGLSLAVSTVSAAGFPISFECKNEKKSGKMFFNAAREGANLVLTVKYPVMIQSLLGGHTKGSKSWSADVDVYLDVDNDPKTGLEGNDKFDPGKRGSKFKVRADEIRTAVGRDAEGNSISKPVLDAEIEKMGDYVERPDGYYPEWEFLIGKRFELVNWVEPQASDTMRLVSPLTLFGLEPGDTIRVTGVAPSCNTSYLFEGHGEAKITLE